MISSLGMGWKNGSYRNVRVLRPAILSLLGSAAGRCQLEVAVSAISPLRGSRYLMPVPRHPRTVLNRGDGWGPERM